MTDIFNDFKLDVWYRNFKCITALEISNNIVKLSNKDKIVIKQTDIYINNKLVCNVEITADELLRLYKYNLINRGYKII